MRGVGGRDTLIVDLLCGDAATTNTRCLMLDGLNVELSMERVLLVLQLDYLVMLRPRILCNATCVNP